MATSESDAVFFIHILSLADDFYRVDRTAKKREEKIND